MRQQHVHHVHNAGAQVELGVVHLIILVFLQIVLGISRNLLRSKALLKFVQN